MKTEEEDVNEFGRSFKIKGTKWRRIAVVCEMAERENSHPVSRGIILLEEAG